MSNRHERRRAAKIGAKMMDLSELAALPSGCAWDGCEHFTHDPDKHGWSKLMLYRGKTALDFMEIDPALMDRDCVLCPEHARQLDERFLKDIGGSLRHVQGAA